MDVNELPPLKQLSLRPAVLVAQLSDVLGEQASARLCADLLRGAEPREFAAALPYLAGAPGAAFLDGRWPAYWPRVWGARGLRYVWAEEAQPAAVDGLDDLAWRVAEMCLKVSALREIAEAGPAAVVYLDHELPRVRAAASRALGIVGDTEHVAAVERCLSDDDEQVRRSAARALALMSARLDLGDHPGRH